MQDVAGGGIKFEPNRPEIAENERPVENGAPNWRNFEHPV